MKNYVSKIKMGGLLGFGLIFVCSLLLGIFAPSVSAQNNNEVTYIDKVAVRYNGNVYIDGNPYDDTREWVRGEGNCPERIRSQGNGNATVLTECGGGLQPNGGGITVPIRDPNDRKNVNAYRVSAEKIFLPIGLTSGGCNPLQNSTVVEAQNNIVEEGARATGRGRYYQRDADRSDDAPENQYLLIKDNSDLDSEAIVRTDAPPVADFIFITSCALGIDETDELTDIITISTREIPDIYGTNDPSTPNGSRAGSEGEEESTDDENATCEAAGGINWLLCPVFNGIADFTDWLFKTIIEPFLYTTPISTDPDDESYQVWSSFRLYANIALILGMLVIVLAQIAGGGAIDAYTAKKVLPKILAAAILINLSVYMINFLVDVTNILGKGLGDLLFAPFAASGSASFVPGASEQAGAVVGTGVALFAGSASIAGFLGTILFGGLSGIGAAAVYVGLAVVIPAMIAVIGVFVVLVIRQGLMLFLIISSPIAFILYALPNGEKYFKQWWDLLIKTLMMYPIIVIIFTMADILSITIIESSQNSGATAAAIAGIVAFVLQFLPLFLVPFAFKFAGAAVAGIYAAVSNGSKKASELTKSRREFAKENYDAHAIASRQSGYRKLKDYSNKHRVGKRSARFLAGRIGGYNIEAEYAALRKKQFQQADDQINFGDDTEYRALTAVQKQVRESDGTVRTAWISAGGKEVKEADVKAANARWKGNHAIYQKALAYEIKKATEPEQHENIIASLPQLQKQWGMDDAQMGSTLVGAGFAMQDKNKEYKHTGIKNGQVTFAGSKFVDELHAALGTYQGGAQDANTARRLQDVYAEAHAVLQQGRNANNAAAYDNAQKTFDRIGEIAKQYEGQTLAQTQNVVGQAQAAQQTPTAPGSAAATAGEIHALLDMTKGNRPIQARTTTPQTIDLGRAPEIV